MTIQLVAAVDQCMGIAKGGELPWYLPPHLRWFSKLTSGGTVIMGRRTFNTLPGVLPNRRSIVVTQNPPSRREVIYPGRHASVFYAGSLDEAFAIAGAYPWVIGGGTLFAQTLERAEVLHLTRIEHDFGCDTFLSPIPERLQPVRAERHVEKGLAFTFETWRSSRRI